MSVFVGSIPADVIGFLYSLYFSPIQIATARYAAAPAPQHNTLDLSSSSFIDTAVSRAVTDKSIMGDVNDPCCLVCHFCEAFCQGKKEDRGLDDSENPANQNNDPQQQVPPSVITTETMQRQDGAS